MNYAEIKAAALSYSDRSDPETEAMIDTFLPIVESRINRKLRTLDMTASLPIIPIGGELNPIAVDISGIKEVKLVQSTGYETVEYGTPAFLDGLSQNPDATVLKHYYNIVGREIRILPIVTTNTIQITYYKHVTALTDAATENWLSEKNPDAYVFGILVEISSFAKDAEAKVLWNDRFIESIADIETEDNLTKWSGTPQQIRIG